MEREEVLDWAWTVFADAIAVPIDQDTRPAFDKRFGHGCQRLADHPRVWEREREELERVLRMMGAATGVAARFSTGSVSPDLALAEIDALATASGTPFCPPPDGD